MDDELIIESLDTLLQTNTPPVFYMRVSASNERLRIKDNDIIVVDKSLDPINDDVVVAIVNAKFVIRRYNVKDGVISLYGNSDQPSEVFENSEPEIWGVVTASVTQLNNLK